MKTQTVMQPRSSIAIGLRRTFYSVSFMTAVAVYLIGNAVSAASYGTLLGSFNGVNVYSNGSSSYASGVDHYINGVYIGMKWQCVEFVRRYYFQVYGVNLSSAHRGHAKTFWDSTAASRMGLVRYANGGNVAPQVGDMIVSTAGSYGHIAIVRSVSSTQVRVAQQNVTQSASDADYQLSLTISNGNYTVGGFTSGLPVAGWMRRQGAVPPVCTAGSSVNYVPNGYAPVHSNGALIKHSSDPTIYVIREGMKHGISSQAVLEYLYPNGGFRFDDVINVSQAEFDSYSTASQAINATLPSNGRTRPDGTVIRRPNGEISVVSGNGGRRGFASYSLFLNMGYKDCNVVNVSDTEYNSYPTLNLVDAMSKLTASLRLYNIGSVGQSMRGEFTIRNVGSSSFTFSKLGIGGRLNNSTIVDFPFRTNITLAPGQSYSYVDHFTPATAGTYRFFVAYAEASNVWTTSVPRHNGVINTETITISGVPPTPTPTPIPTPTATPTPPPPPTPTPTPTTTPTPVPTPFPPTPTPTPGPPTPGARQFDFDGDRRADISIYRPGLGQWWYQRSSDGAVSAATFGTSTDVITPADFTGDGRTDMAFFRPSEGRWYILRSENLTYYTYQFGQNGDLPAPADYDGDGRDDFTVYRPSVGTWFVRQSGNGQVSTANFGNGTDRPVPADYDGDGRDDIAIWRRHGSSGAGEWWIQRSTAGILAVRFGGSTDRAVPGDYTGDGRADVAIFRPVSGQWFILRSENLSYYSFAWGNPNDIPAPADYDGDGLYNPAVFRPSERKWYISRAQHPAMVVGFGLSTDAPVASAFVR